MGPEYNIQIRLVIKLIIVTNIQWHAANKSYDCLLLRRQEVAVLVKIPPLQLVFFKTKVFVVNLQQL
ncbi:hypothetical protein H4V96_001285 [Janthinobacterium sp. CG_23.4]|jgi:hypothetical protein|nr:hypothetical protein [Janthinobacterium sp. CG_23.4]